MKDTGSGHKRPLLNILLACVLLSILIGVVSLHSSAQEANTPTPTPTDMLTVAPLPNATAALAPSIMPSVTPASNELVNNTSAIAGGSGGGLEGTIYSNLLPLAAATMAIIIIVCGVAYIRSNRGKAPEVPKEPSRQELYGMATGGQYKRSRRTGHNKKIS